MDGPSEAQHVSGPPCRRLGPSIPCSLRRLLFSSRFPASLPRGFASTRGIEAGVVTLMAENHCLQAATTDWAR